MIVSFILMLIVILTGCNANNKHIESPRTEPTNLTISAAASLTFALNEIKALYEAQNQSIQLVMNYASSGVLRQQIAQGAPSDIFISASSHYMDELNDSGRILQDSRQELLTNSMVLITDKKSELTGFDSLLSSGVTQIAIGVPESVPAGQYGKETLQYLGLWDQIEPKIILAKDVRQIVAYIESGNVDAGIVYKTDALLSQKVKIIAEAPPESHTRISYPVALVEGSKAQEDAQAFIEFLTNDPISKEIFEQNGFNFIGR